MNFIFPGYWECHHPNVAFILFRGVGIPPIRYPPGIESLNMAIEIFHRGLREAKLLLGQDSDSDGEPDAKKADLKHGEILRVKMCQNPVGLQRHTEIQNMI